MKYDLCNVFLEKYKRLRSNVLKKYLEIPASKQWLSYLCKGLFGIFQKSVVLPAVEP